MRCGTDVAWIFSRGVIHHVVLPRLRSTLSCLLYRDRRFITSGLLKISEGNVLSGKCPIPPCLSLRPNHSSQPFVHSPYVIETKQRSAALIGTNTSYRQVFSRLSSFHAEHPLARAAAAADATEATGGLSFVAPSSLRRNSFDEVPDGYPLVESSIASLSTQQQLPKRRGTLLLLVKALPGGDESRLLAGRAAVRRHACFVERMDGTPSKFYVDLKGGVAGPRIVYVSCVCVYLE